MTPEAAHPPVAPTSDDLMGQETIKQSVRQAYREVMGKASTVAARLYDREQLAHLPPGAIAQALGVGNPIRAARLEPGEVVVDLGCGGGIDTLLAARGVAPAGKAIGVDMLPEMLEVAARHAAQAGISNVEWRQGYLEDIPLPDASVDVVISNGVVNLSPRKSRVFAEMHRILRPGGRFTVADIVVDEDLPPEILTNPAAWAG
jgi:SAM-dependent methyltransferase